MTFTVVFPSSQYSQCLFSLSKHASMTMFNAALIGQVRYQTHVKYRSLSLFVGESHRAHTRLLASESTEDVLCRRACSERLYGNRSVWERYSGGELCMSFDLLPEATVLCRGLVCSVSPKSINLHNKIGNVRFHRTNIRRQSPPEQAQTFWQTNKGEALEDA